MDPLELLSFGDGGWGDELASGTLVTVSLALTTLPFGLALGFGIALAKNSPEPMLRSAAGIYTTIFRGLPELLTLFLIYYGGQIALTAASLALFGVPVGRAEAPEATFTEGRVGRVTTLGSAVSDWRQNRLIQHSALTTGGTSGSPLIDHEGRIVGINAGASGSAKRDVVIDERTGKALPVRIVGETGYKYAMRIDLLTDLMAQNGLALPKPPPRR